MTNILDSIRKELDAFSFTMTSFNISPVFQNGLKLKTTLVLNISHKGSEIGQLVLSLLDGKVSWEIKALKIEASALEVLNFLSNKYRYSLDSYCFIPLLISFSIRDLERNVIVGFLTVTYDRGLKFQFEKVL